MGRAPTYVFIGPTISPDQARAYLPDATFLPPVAQGDVYRALRTAPDAIGIIDGFFDHVPAVWHKEILFALCEGVRVYGAASMGALRAAELDRFGMVGVGEIYESYRDGILEDDDEVAIAHATSENAYREISDAMVNIRATTCAAQRAGVIGAATKGLIDQAAKALFYPDRTFQAAMDGAAALGAQRQELKAFRTWLPAGTVHAKRADAVRMLEHMRRSFTAERTPFRFSHTVFFAELAASAPWDLSAGAEIASGYRGVLDELRLAPDLWRRSMLGATIRALADTDADERGLVVSDEALVDTTTTFRRERGLHDSPDLAAWLDLHDLDGEAFITLMEDETRLGWFMRAYHDEALERLPDELRASGRLPALRARAHEKDQWIASQGLASVSLDHLGLREADIFSWYFRDQLNRDVPSDIWAHARAAGFSDVEEFRRAVVRDYLFTKKDSQRERRREDRRTP